MSDLRIPMTGPAPESVDRIADSLTALIDAECDRRARNHQKNRSAPIPRTLTFLPAAPSGARRAARHAVIGWRTGATDRWWTPGYALCSRGGDKSRTGLKADSHLGLDVVSCAQCVSVLESEGVL